MTRTRTALQEAVAFLTALPAPRSAPTPEALAWFPAAGAAIGAAEGALWRLARRLLPDLPAAVLAVLADAVITGGLHLDGLADAADGLFAHAPSKDRLDIMSAPDIGAFGTVALGLALIGRSAALASLEPSPLLLAALACGSRSAMATSIGCLPYARAAGLASAFAGPGGRRRALRSGLGGLGLAAAMGALAAGRRGLLAVGSGAVAAGAVLLAAKKRVGGYTGDVLGAAGSAFEVAGLLAATRR